MFFLTLGRKKELVDYIKISWEIKCARDYFPHKVMKDWPQPRMKAHA